MYVDPNCNITRFDSVQEAGQFFLRNKNKYEQHERREWLGGLDYTELATLAMVGDDSCVESAEKLIEEFTCDAQTSCTEETPSVAGFYPIVPEYLSGAPDCMREFESSKSSSAPLSIIYNMTSTGSIDAETMRRRGIAALAAAIAISKSRPVSLDVISAVDGRSRAGAKVRGKWSIVTAKVNTSPLDTASAALALTRVGFARALFYGYAAVEHGYTGGWPYFDGKNETFMTVEEKTEHIRNVLELTDEVLYMPPAVDCFSDLSLTDPKAWVHQIIERYTAGLQPA